MVFLSDCGDSVRNLQAYLHPDSEHWLDWFHITMRISVLQQQVPLALVSGVHRSLRPLPMQCTRAPFPSATSSRRRPVISESASQFEQH